MKNYKKALLTVAVLTAMSLMAAEDSTIYVTTFADEDGENASQCSLREAVTAASTHKAYGGCPKGQQYNTVTNVIQLEAGEYKLNKELQPNADLLILGKQPIDFSQPNAITNEFPAATPIKTSISGQNKSRIFNTTQLNKPSLSLQNIVLKDAFSHAEGGALFVGGGTNLVNVSILNSSAQAGGAIYLNDTNSSITVRGGEIRGNKAPLGSILAMSCMDNLEYTIRKIDFSATTFIENGSNDSQSGFAFCGQPTVNINSTTMTGNIANIASGSLIRFSSTAINGSGSISAASSLRLLSNTIVKNTAQSILAYNTIAEKNLNFNIIGFNQAKACRYTDGDVNALEFANIFLTSNALNLISEVEKCELPVKVQDGIKSNTFELNGRRFDSLLSTLQTAQADTGFLPLYFPKDTGSDQDLVDVGTLNCDNLDQRGITRLQRSNADNPSSVQNSCDIGSTEIMKLSVANIVQTNVSVIDLMKSYQAESDLFKSLIEDKTTKSEYLNFYKMQYEKFQNLITQTEATQQYRTIFIDPFMNNLPDEQVDATGGRQIRHLTVDNYDVNVESQGVGKLDSAGQFIGVYDQNLKCVWNPALKQILMYRTDDRLTPSGDKEFCKYTLTSKNSSPIKSSSAYISTQFINIPPVVPVETNFVIQHGGAQKISVDLLKDAHDKGDGLVSKLVSKPNKPAFYQNAQGQTQAIRFVKVPDAVSVSAERSGPCPGIDRKETCYGGNITVQLNNTLDVFSHKLQYQVYDADETISNVGLINLNNTATAPDSVRVSGGGGSMGWWSAFGLVGLVFMRRRMQKKI